MLKTLIVAYMVLFTAFDTLAEKQVALDLHGQNTEISQSLGNNETSFRDELSGAHERENCPDSRHCPDCHECHLGHCGLLTNSTVTIKTFIRENSYFSKSKIYESRDYNSVFRPPIKA